MLDTLQRSKKFFSMSYFLVLLTACGNTDVKTSKASLPPAESNIDTSLKAPNWVDKSPIQQSPNFTEDKKYNRL